MNCAKCGKELKADAKFCVGCGTPAAAQMPSPPARPATGIPAPPPPPAHQHPAGVPKPPPPREAHEVWSRAPADDGADDSAGQFSEPKKIPRAVLLGAAAAAVLAIAMLITFSVKKHARENPVISGVYTSKEQKFTMTFPRGVWKMIPEGGEVSGGATGGFRRDGGALLKVISANIPTPMPEDIPDEVLMLNKKGFISQVSKFVAGEGYVFEEGDFTIYPAGGAIGMIIEGAATRGGEKRRVLVHLALLGKDSWFFLFIHGEDGAEAFRKEALGMIDSLVFGG